MTRHTYDDILTKAERFAPPHFGGICQSLGQEVLSLYDELDNPDLTPAQQQRIALRLRALVREMQSLHCPLPSEP